MNNLSISLRTYSCQCNDLLLQIHTLVLRTGFCLVIPIKRCTPPYPVPSLNAPSSDSHRTFMSPSTMYAPSFLLLFSFEIPLLLHLEIQKKSWILSIKRKNDFLLTLTSFQDVSWIRRKEPIPFMESYQEG